VDERIEIFDDFESLSDSFIEKWTDIALNAISANSLFCAALSGGKTPLPIYNKLSQNINKSIADKSHIFTVDERFVPHDNTESNSKNIREAMSDFFSGTEACFYPVKTEGITPKQSAASYEKSIINFFGKNNKTKIPSFDLTVLGVGEDGHTASLFPGTSDLNEESKLVINTNAPGKKHPRITMTFPLINCSKNIIIIITGKNKAKIAKSVIEDNEKKYPASYIGSLTGATVCMLDKDAASLLEDEI